MSEERRQLIAEKLAALKLEQKRAQGMQMRPEWVRRFEDACGHQPELDDFLSIEQTKDTKSKFYARIKERKGTFLGCWPREHFASVAWLLRDLSANVEATWVVLFSRVDHLTGAIRLPAPVILENAEAVWKVVCEGGSLATRDLSFVALDFQHGLMLSLEDYYPDSTMPVGDRVLLWLTAWGDFIPASGKVEERSG